MLARKWWTLIAGCTAIFMLLLDVSIVNVAVPSILRALHAGFSDLQWVIDAYALTLASLLLAAGSLADRVGRRRLFTLGLAVFTFSSLMAGFAMSPLWLHLARGAQGVGGAMMFATSLALIAQEFRGRERGTALGIWGATTAAALLCWTAIGRRADRRAVVALDLSGQRSDRSGRDRDLATAPGRVTCPACRGARPARPRGSVREPVLLVFALIRGSTLGWGSATILAALAGAAVGLVSFVLIELRASEPLLDLRLFRKPAFTGATLVAFCLSGSTLSMFLYITLFFQNVLGYSPLQAVSGSCRSPACCCSFHRCRDGCPRASLPVC